ncbi:hypothetical protein CEXT_152021 [Caerostris extrusa]|uniref:Uncharacterized protein n=1 Tax=Caerostris extrusa TaxID=172846 RepID=A0AAV4WDD1_CAEEX|nr:hypothetical protein CEXT_152021 [Caerostris extrusa]
MNESVEARRLHNEEFRSTCSLLVENDKLDYHRPLHLLSNGESNLDLNEDSNPFRHTGEASVSVSSEDSG